MVFVLIVCLNIQCMFPFIDTTNPFSFHSQTAYQITPRSQFRILGEVEGESSYIIVAGIAIGDAGYDAAYRDAISQIPQADALIDVKVDRRVFSFLGIFIRISTKLTGKAIKFTPQSERE